MTEVARLRSVLLQGRDALVVAVGDHQADLDDSEDEGSTVYEDLAVPLAKALAALRPGSQGGTLAMARRPHAHTGERRESSKARQAWIDYRDMPEGQRSLAKLVERYRTATESPPTRSLERLKAWSTIFCWQARLAAWQAELDHARRAAQIRQTQEQVRQNTVLMQQVGQGSLALCALTLHELVDAQTGELRRPIEVRDLCGLMKAGSELLGLATGSPTQIVSSQDSVQLERILRESDSDTRTANLNGLRAALRGRETHGG